MEIRKRYIIPSTAADVWRALTDTAAIEAWGGGPAEMDATPGGRFSLWGGDIHGTNTEVSTGSRLVQEWWSGDWDEPSVVVFTIEEDAEGTALDLLHTGVPGPQVTDFDRGWDDYYLGPLRDYLTRDDEEG